MGCFPCFTPRRRESSSKIDDSTGDRSNAVVMGPSGMMEFHHPDYFIGIYSHFIGFFWFLGREWEEGISELCSELRIPRSCDRHSEFQDDQFDRRGRFWKGLQRPDPFRPGKLYLITRFFFFFLLEMHLLFVIYESKTGF